MNIWLRVSMLIMFVGGGICLYYLFADNFVMTYLGGIIAWGGFCSNPLILLGIAGGIFHAWKEFFSG